VAAAIDSVVVVAVAVAASVVVLVLVTVFGTVVGFGFAEAGWGRFGTGGPGWAGTG
jgi:hypothetical protein